MKTVLISLVISITSIVSIFAHGNVIYVSPDGTGDGSTWATATSFTNAVDIVSNSEEKPQLWVRKGIYHFTTPVNFDYLFIYGGFKGDETSLEQRNWATNQTIFDGGGISSILRSTRGNDREGGNNTSIPALLDGVIVQNGYITGDQGGAAAINKGAEIRNCIFRNNKNNSGHAGALFLQGGVGQVNEYIIVNSLFINNYAHQNGGAIQVSAQTKGTFINCTFANNQANTQTGGAVGAGAPLNSHSIFINTIAYNNYGNGERSSYGGAANIEQGATVISLHSAIESASTRFTDSDDEGHIVLSESVSPRFRSPSSIIGYSEGDQDNIFMASYELSGSSPCINTGTESGLPAGVSLPEKDLAGKMRVHDIVDMGAFEYIIDAFFSWLLAPAIFVEEDIAMVVGPGESAAAFTKFYVNGAPVEFEGGAINLSGLTGEIVLKATTEDSTEIIRLIITR